MPSRSECVGQRIDRQTFVHSFDRLRAAVFLVIIHFATFLFCVLVLVLDWTSETQTYVFSYGFLFGPIRMSPITHIPIT